MTKLNLKQKIEQTTDWLYNKFCGATIGRLPGLYKRSLFISSVYGLLKENKNPEAVNLKRLNDLLQINYSQEGFSTGIQVTSLIWHNLEKHPTVHCGAGDFCLYEVANDDIMSHKSWRTVTQPIRSVLQNQINNSIDLACRHDIVISNFSALMSPPFASYFERIDLIRTIV
jgi:hypothetical protein